jgi:FkbM family methyltransferase
MDIMRFINGGAKTLGFEVSSHRPSQGRRLFEIKGRTKTVGIEVFSHKPSPQHLLFEALLNVLGETASDALPFLKYWASNMTGSHAQLFQDLLVLFLLNEKREGYFVEFGAMNGITLSNTFLLENKFGWRGIVAEPARCWQRELVHNRACSVDVRCVWSRSGETLDFNETVEPELSTIDALTRSDFHAKRRQDGRRYPVETISLRDLLRDHNAPMTIDYLSIDTEGSEFAILDSFFPSDHEICIITVEHNYTEQRSRIYSLLKSWGYNRVFEELSMWDDWYIKSNLR